MKKKNQKKSIPKFKNEDEEAKFWDEHNSMDYFNEGGSVHLALPEQNTMISIRFPKHLLNNLKRLAKIKDVPYQSLIKLWLDDRLKEEWIKLKKAA